MPGRHLQQEAARKLPVGCRELEEVERGGHGDSVQGSVCVEWKSKCGSVSCQQPAHKITGYDSRMMHGSKSSGRMWPPILLTRNLSRENQSTPVSAGHSPKARHCMAHGTACCTILYGPRCRTCETEELLSYKTFSLSSIMTTESQTFFRSEISMQIAIYLALRVLF